jgi:putative colanic acid biosynthesis glycosyltransferase
MKILQISSEGNIGSVGSIAEQIGVSLIDSGHVSHIAIGDYVRPSRSRIYKIGTFIDKYFHAFETRFFDRNGLSSRGATNRLVSWIEKISPDLIHIHQFHGYYLNYEILLKYLEHIKIPVVVTLHDCWIFTGHCTYFESVGCNKWQSLCNNCELITDYPKSLFFDNSRNNFLLKKNLFSSINNLNLVSVSNWLDSQVSKSFLSNKSRHVIYNGIDLKIYHKKNIDRNNFLPNNLCDKFVILGVASPWNSRKGLQDFISLSKIIDENYVIVLIGLSSSQISNLPHNIIGIEKIVDRSILVDYYNIADVYVSFSKEETFGLTTVEAMACGTPPILYNSTASPEIISSDTGFLIDKYDIYKAYQVINFLRCNPDVLNEFSINCVKRVKSNFNSLDRFKDYVKLYAKILNV